MMPNITRGGRTAGLMTYLVTQSEREQHSNVHENPHVIGGHDVVTQNAAEGPLAIDDALDLANLLDQPRRVFGTRVTLPVKEWDDERGKLVKSGEKDAHVWHASLSLKAEEGQLTDHQWQAVANDFVAGMGFVDPDGAKSCRWVAIRHGVSAEGNDHVHIVVNLVREDGSKAPVHDDFKRAQKLSNELEHKYGLSVLESREQDRETLRGNKPADLESARATGDLTTERDELRRRLRSVAVTSTSERDFVERTRAARVLIRPRYAKGDRDQVVGYSAALVPQVKDGERPDPIWHAGSKLDTNLGLGQLRARWGADTGGSADALPAWRGRTEALRTGEHGFPDRITPTRLPDETVRRINETAEQIVIPERGSLTRFAAADLSGAFAHASLYFEKGGVGPLAEASDVFARIGQQDRYSPQDPARAKRQTSQLATDAAYISRLASRATGQDSRTGWIAVMKQLGRLGKAVETAQRERGALQSASAARLAMAGAVAKVDAATRQTPTGSTPAPQARHDRPEAQQGRDNGSGRE